MPGRPLKYAKLLGKSRRGSVMCLASCVADNLHRQGVETHSVSGFAYFLKALQYMKHLLRSE